MLTKIEPNGVWSCEGIDVTKVDGPTYWALCKLRDYEKTGMNPSDFRSESYDNRYMYKVFYTDFEGVRRTILCDSEKTAKEMEENLKSLGYKDVVRNLFSWQTIIEK